jgi:hypothetical protein
VAERAYESKSFRGWPRRLRLKSCTPPQEWRMRKRLERGCRAKTREGCVERRKVESFARPDDSHRLPVRQGRYPSIPQVFSLETFIGISLGRF